MREHNQLIQTSTGLFFAEALTGARTAPAKEGPQGPKDRVKLASGYEILRFPPLDFT